MKHLFFILALFGLLTLNTNKAQAQKIDCGCSPELPDKSWSIDPKSPKMDNIGDLSQIKFKEPKLINEGTSIDKPYEFATKGFNACVLDFLVDHPELIPQSWKSKNIIFTGTIYIDGGGSIFFRTLFFNKDKNMWDKGRSYTNYILEHTFLLEA